MVTNQQERIPDEFQQYFLRERIRRDNRLRWAQVIARWGSAILIALACLLLAALVASIPQTSIFSSYRWSMLYFCYLCILPLVWGSIRRNKNAASTDLESLESQIELAKLESNPHERRAEMLFRLSDLQLKDYYDLNIRQNKHVFYLGLGCLVAGLFVLCVTLFLLLNYETDDSTKLVIGVVGGVGSILTNFVAAIYLRMHIGTLSSLTTLHGRLVDSNQRLLSNLLVSQVGDEAKRHDALVTLANNLSGSGKANGESGGDA